MISRKRVGVGNKRTHKTHAFEAVIVILFFAVSALANFPITGYQTAPETKTAATANAATVETIILVNGGDKSTIDAAIAAAISYDRGIPVLYTDHKDIPPEVLSELLNGDYKDVKNVVIIGGDAVVSDIAQTSLEQIGETAGYDITRIAGATATGTAVEAVEYFYGPKMLSEVTLVQYTNDNDQSQQEYLHLSAQLGHPIIPVPNDLEGLPADVAQAINDMGIDDIIIVGDVHDAIKTEISDLGADIGSVFTGTQAELEKTLEEEIKDLITSEENIILIKEGLVPPILPDHKVFFYKDENNDNLDDDTGSVLDGIGRGLYDDIESQLGVKPEIKFISDDENIQKQFEEKLEQEGVKVEIGKASDSVETAVIFAKEAASKIGENFGQKQEDFQRRYEQNKPYFEEKLPLLVDQFKAYYVTLDKTTLPSRSLELATKIIDENNKGDALAQWQLMNAFANSYKHENYIGCDNACKQEYIESERSTINEKYRSMVGTNEAENLAGVAVQRPYLKYKVSMLGTDDFMPPTIGNIQLLKERYDKLVEEGTSAEQLREEFVKDYKDEAYEKYREQINEEYTIEKSGTDPSKWNDQKLHEEFDRRLQYESEAYRSGLISQEQYDDPTKRAEVFSTFATVDTTLRNSGVPNTAYLTSTEWKTAYNSYTTTGKLTAEDLKGYEAAATAYKTYENQHEGGSYDPQAGTYNTKTGQFSYVDPVKESLVAGSYNTDTKQYTYVNDDGELVQGNRDGEVHAYEQHELPVGYKYDEKAGSYSYQGTGIAQTYTPPAEYHEDTGKYVYEYVNPSTGSTYTYSNSYYYTPPSPTASGSSNLADSATGTTTEAGYTSPTTSTSTTTVMTTDSTGTTTSTSTYSGGTTYTGSTTTSGMTSSGTTNTGGHTGSYSAPSGDSGGGGYSAPAPSAPSGGEGGGAPSGGGGY